MALVLYAPSRWGGRGLVIRYGGLLRLTEEDLNRAEGYFSFGLALSSNGARGDRILRGAPTCDSPQIRR